MTDFVDRARRFVDECFPMALAAFLGGSASSGRATDSSDLDILVVLPAAWTDAAFVETSRFEGQLVEAFVYGRTALEDWLKKGRGQRRPVLDRLIGDGVVLEESDTATVLREKSRQVLVAGPPPGDPADLRARAYSLSAVLDDLADASGAGESYVLSGTVWREAAELALLLRRRWLGTGKWLFRELAAAPDEFGLVAWAAGDRQEADLRRVGLTVLDEAGGYLQEGFLRGERPPDL